jgi:phage-related protein
MSSNLSVATVVEKNRIGSGTPFLVALDIEVINPATGIPVTTIRVVNNTEPVTWGGNEYTPMDFKLDLHSAKGEQPNLNLSLFDYSRGIQAYMQEYGGGVGFNVTVYVLNADALDRDAEIAEFFQVIGAGAADYSVSFTLGAENALAKPFPRRRQTKDFCQWRYKSAECGYTGGLPTCDLSLQGANGCAAHNNTPRFGGFPGINIRLNRSR